MLSVVSKGPVIDILMVVQSHRTGRREQDARPTISISWKNSVRTHCGLLPEADLGADWGRGQRISKLHSPAALWVYLCYEMCKDVQMGAPSWRVLMTRRLCAGRLLAGGHPAPAVSPKPTHSSPWHGPEDTLVPEYPGCAASPSWPAWTPSPSQLRSSPGSLHTRAGHEEAHSTFSSTSHVLCTSENTVAKSIKETRSVYVSKGRNISVFSSW